MPTSYPLLLILKQINRGNRNSRSSGEKSSNTTKLCGGAERYKPMESDTFQTFIRVLLFGGNDPESHVT